MARGVAKKGAGGWIESVGRKAIRNYLREATEGKPVKKIPSSKLDKTRYDESRSYLKSQGLEGKELNEAMDDELAAGGLGELNPEAHGLSRSQIDELDDLNTKKEAIRKARAESAPTIVPGEPKEPRKLYPSEKWKKERRGGRIELGKVGGKKAKRRLDKKVRR